MKYLWLLKLACAASYIVCTAFLSTEKADLCLSYHNECSIQAKLHVTSFYPLPVCSKHGEPCISQHDYNSCAYLNTTTVNLDNLYSTHSPNSTLILNSLILASFLLLLTLLFDGDRTENSTAQSFASRKENVWMHWVIFALAIALIGVSSYMIEHDMVNSSASCVSGSEEDCASLGDCSFETIGVGNAALSKRLTVAALVCAVVFTVVFMVPFDESEFADFVECPRNMFRLRSRRVVAPQTPSVPQVVITPVVTIEQPTECAICLEFVKSSPDVSDSLAPHALPCGHVFHHACIEQWSRQADASHVQNQCPLCRTPV